MANADAFIEEVTKVTPELVEAWSTLSPQLSKSAPNVTDTVLSEIVESPATVLFIARLSPGAPIVGSLTLAIFRIPTGMRAWIEDVVVDEGARGQRIGERLTRAAIERATGAGARTVDLTSRPTREAANRLYQRVGFRPRETNVYRYSDEDNGSKSTRGSHG